MKKLILIVTGGRHLDDLDLIANETLAIIDPIEKKFSGVELWHGDASGVDLAFDALGFSLGAKTKIMNEADPINFPSDPYALKVFQPDWKLGPRGGPKRNKWMIEKGLLAESLGHTVKLLSFPGGKGTRNCTEEAHKQNIEVVDLSSLKSPVLEKIAFTEKLNGSEDGLTHLNIYSQAKTEMGKFLSNFTRIPSLETPYGKFISLEGYYFYLSSLSLKNTNMEKSLERLKTVYGYEAKKLGSELFSMAWNSEEHRNSELRLSEDVFRELFTDSLIAKINASSFKEKFIKNTLPLCHYYDYHGNLVVGAGQWIIMALDLLKKN